MPAFNQFNCIGYLGQDPEYNEDRGVANCSVAVNKTFKRKGEEESQPMWIRIAVWGKRGEAFAKHTSKGDPILFTMELDQNSYTDKAGEERTSLQGSVSNWSFVKPKQESKSDGQEPWDEDRS